MEMISIQIGLLDPSQGTTSQGEKNMSLTVSQVLISGLEQSSDPCQDTRRQDVIAPPETMLLNKAEEQIAQVQEAVGLLSRQWEYGI